MTFPPPGSRQSPSAEAGPAQAVPAEAPSAPPSAAQPPAVQPPAQPARPTPVDPAQPSSAAGPSSSAGPSQTAAAPFDISPEEIAQRARQLKLNELASLEFYRNEMIARGYDAEDVRKMTAEDIMETIRKEELQQFTEDLLKDTGVRPYPGTIFSWLYDPKLRLHTILYEEKGVEKTFTCEGMKPIYEEPLNWLILLAKSKCINTETSKEEPAAIQQINVYVSGMLEEKQAAVNEARARQEERMRSKGKKKVYPKKRR